MRFKDKVDVVTGRNSRIGKAIAKDFILKGAKVAVLGLSNQNDLEEFHASK